MAKKKKIVVPQEWGELLPVFIENPNDMLEEYFSTFDLKICKQVMWIFLRETMTGEFVDTMSRTERDRVLHFYAYTTSLLEALNIKHQKQQKKRSKKKSAG